MTGTQITILIGAIVLFDLIVVPLLVKALVNAFWGTLSKRYPAVEPEADAVRKNFQSISSNGLNMGFSVHIAVDAAHLHLYPARFFRWFGAVPVSIPWTDIEHLKSGRLTRYSTIRVPPGKKIGGPAWAFDFAKASGA